MRRISSSIFGLAASAVACHSPVAPEPVVPLLAYETGAIANPPMFQWSAPGDPYLLDLNSRYALTSVVASSPSDLERARAVSHWVRGRFDHDGSNASTAGDPIGILVGAAKGQRFRCVEYAAVVSGALTAIGIPARSVWLLTYEEPTRTDGVAHVVAEAYLRDLGRWVMVDAQWDVLPTVDGKPVSVLELQQAMGRNHAGVGALSGSGVTGSAYQRWIAPYLYYLYTPLDARVGVTRTPGALLLSPIGDARLTAKYPAPVIHSHSIGAFYPHVR